MSNTTRSAAGFHRWLWRQVERHQRRPPWQRLLINSLWLLLGMAVVCFWVWLWDCPIC